MSSNKLFKTPAKRNNALTLYAQPPCWFFLHSPAIVVAVTQDHCNGQKSRQTPKIMVFTVIIHDYLAALNIGFSHA